jgi:outer membrane protein assembly factor BamE (lipoprotein component of BamABCDE complex)
MSAKRIAIGPVVCALAIAMSGCASTERREPGAAQPVQAAAWQNLQVGMSHMEVLTLLGPPQSADIRRTRTFWFYSERRMDGPRVELDTRDMTVSSWRRP